MKRLLFSVLALSIGAFAFVSCDKDDEKEEKRGSYLSIEAQQNLFTEAFIKSGEQVEFEGLAESVRNIIYNFAGRPLIVDSAYAQIKQDREAARKMNAIKEMDGENISFDGLYFGVDLVLNETVVEGDTIMLAQVQKINHNVDRFIINMESNKHVLNSSLKVSASRTGAVEVNTPGKEGATNVEIVKLPSVVSFAVKMDGNPVLGADVNISSDYLIKIVEVLDDNDDTKVESVTINGSNLNMNGAVSVGNCSFGGKLSYTEQAGINIGAAAKVNGSEILGADINIKAVLANNTNYADLGNLMGLAMTGINGVSANARLNSDEIVFKAEISKNPVNVIMPILAATEEEMPALIDSLKDAFKCGIYFKGYSEPQAKLTFVYQPVDKSDIVQTESESIIDQLVAAIANSGISVLVDTYNAEGKKIVVPAKEYFGKIDVAQFAQGMTEKFNAAFAETLAPLFNVGVEDFDLTQILKVIIFNNISGHKEGDIITEG